MPEFVQGLAGLQAKEGAEAPTPSAPPARGQMSIVAQLSVKPGYGARFEELFAQAAAKVHAEEPGCLLYQLCKSRDDETKYTVIELYESQAAVELHGKNLAKNSNPEMAAMMAAPPEVLIMPCSSPSGLKQGAYSLAVVAELFVSDVEGFEGAARPLIDAVHQKEPGNLLYCWARHPSGKSVVITELYADKDAFDLHGKTELFKEVIKPLLANAPNISILQTVGKGGAKAALPATLPCKTLILVSNVEEGIPQPEHFKVVESEVSTELKDQEILVQALCLSADPYLRGGIKKGVTPGSPMAVFQSGKVLKSNHPKWAVGDLYGTATAASTVSVLALDQGREDAHRGPIWKLTDLITEAQISYGVGVLGMPGATAYGGLIDVLRPGDVNYEGNAPKEQEVIFISAASGAVGQLVGQIAKNVYGCKVIGSAGGAEKGKLLIDKFGFDHAIDYKTVSTKEELMEKIKECAPKGIDMYFENVGGIHFSAAYGTLRKWGRIAVCGSIENYNKAAGDPTADTSLNLSQTIYMHQRIEGFVCMPWLSGQKGNFLQDTGKWLKEGKITTEETFFDGIENWPLAFAALFTGGNKGKVVIRV